MATFVRINAIREPKWPIVRIGARGGGGSMYIIPEINRFQFHSLFLSAPAAPRPRFYKAFGLIYNFSNVFFVRFYKCFTVSTFLDRLCAPWAQKRPQNGMQAHCATTASEMTNAVRYRSTHAGS